MELDKTYDTNLNVVDENFNLINSYDLWIDELINDGIKFYKYKYTFQNSSLVVETYILFKKTYKSIDFPTQIVFDTMKN